MMGPQLPAVTFTSDSLTALKQEDAMERAQHAMKRGLRKVNKALQQSKSNHFMHLALFCLFVFFVLYAWLRFYKFVKFIT